MYESFAIFVVGWLGSHRWFGDIYGAPDPKDPRPWEYLAIGVLAGLAATLVNRMGLANVDQMPGLFVGLATGAVAAGIARTGIGLMRK